MTGKKQCFEDCYWFRFKNLRLALTVVLKFYTRVAKGLKLKVTKVFGASSYVCWSYRGKTSRGPFNPLSWLIRQSFSEDPCKYLPDTRKIFVFWEIVLVWNKKPVRQIEGMGSNFWKFWRFWLYSIYSNNSIF